MNAFLKMLWSNALRVIVSKLLPWLMSEAARFAADYLPRAVEIVKTVQASTDVPGQEKFRLAGDMLRVELKTQAKAYRDHWIDTVIQAAVGVMKDQPAKAAAAIKVP